MMIGEISFVGHMNSLMDRSVPSSLQAFPIAKCLQCHSSTAQPNQVEGKHAKLFNDWSDSATSTFCHSSSVNSRESFTSSTIHPLVLSFMQPFWLYVSRSLSPCLFVAVYSIYVVREPVHDYCDQRIPVTLLHSSLIISVGRKKAGWDTFCLCAIIVLSTFQDVQHSPKRTNITRPAVSFYLCIN